MERLYTIRGRNGPSLTHHKIQLASFDPTKQFAIVKFAIMPGGTPQQSDCSGMITMGQDDTINPSDPDFGNQNQIAWAHHTVRQPSPPGIGESVALYNYELIDIKLFAYDIWLHTVDTLGNESVNWYLEIKKYSTSDVAGSITSLRQFNAGV